MVKGREPIWPMPVHGDESRNVWVMVIEGKRVRTFRVFSTEPTPGMIEFNRVQLAELLEEPVRASVIEVQMDYFAVDELTATSC